MNLHGWLLKLLTGEFQYRGFEWEWVMVVWYVVGIFRYKSIDYRGFMADETVGSENGDSVNSKSRIALAAVGFAI